MNDSSDESLQVEKPEAGSLARANEVLPADPPASGRGTPLFPGSGGASSHEREHWGTTLEAVGETEHKILGVFWSAARPQRKPALADFHKVGTACRVHRVHEQDGMLQVLVECLQRFRLTAG